MAERQIDPKYLKGLSFRYSERKEVNKDGRKVFEYTPKERPMEASDILSWKEEEREVVMVTADGRKIRVPRKREKEKE